MKSKTSFTFTEKRINNLQASDKTKTYSDKHTPNLKLVVTKNGTKTYYARFKSQSVSHNKRLGCASKLCIDDARFRAIEFINYTCRKPKLAESTKRSKKHKSEFSVNDVFEAYRENELSLRSTIAGRTHALEVSYNCHLKNAIGSVQVNELTRKFTKQFFGALESKGYAVHNRCLTAVKSAFNYALEYEEDFDIVSNPFGMIKKMSGVTRTRYLTHDEAQRLLLALDEVKNQDVADIYRLALFTGARLSNVKQMSWTDVSLGSATWLIPATQTKTRQNYEIPLHDLVLDILCKRQQLSGRSRFVFPSRNKSKYGYITGGDPIWKEAIIAAGLYHDNPNIRPRPHDLRRTFATWQIQSGADISVVSKALCHTSLKHTMIYAHTNSDQVRNAIVGAFKFLG